MVTMKDIANRMRISINAVSLALNNKGGVSEDLRLRVLRIADEMGYIEKKEKFVNTYRKTSLCVMMQQMYQIDVYFYSKVLYALTNEATTNGYDAIIHFFQDDVMVVPNVVQNRRVAGIVVLGKISDKNLAVLLSHNIPLILVDHTSLSIPVNSILTDNKSGGFMAAKHLLDKGFRRIGFWGDLSYSLSIKERYFGFEQAIHTLAPDIAEDALAYSVTADIERYVLKKDSQAIANIIQNRPKLPQAFVCSNDNSAIVLLTALRKLGIEVPRDISLIGFDNTDLCQITVPNLTTIKVDMSGMGKRAIKHLLRVMQHEKHPVETIVMSVSLVERDTVRFP